MLKCDNCLDEVESLTSLTIYGINKLGTCECGDFCSECFDSIYPTLHDKGIGNE